MKIGNFTFDIKNIAFIEDITERMHVTHEVGYTLKTKLPDDMVVKELKVVFFGGGSFVARGDSAEKIQAAYLEYLESQTD